MTILGIGPLELILVLVLALVILGPEDMVGTSRKIGQWVYRVVRSPTWRSILATSQDLRDLPQKIIRDAGLEETMKDIQQTAEDVKTDLSNTTRELTAEMEAATHEATREINAAAQNATEDIRLAAAQAEAAVTQPSTQQGEVEPSILPLRPPTAVPGAAGLVRKPYEYQLNSIAAGLEGKALPEPEPEPEREPEPQAALEPQPQPAAQLALEPMAPPARPRSYAEELDGFARALGAPTGSPISEPPPPAPALAGIPAGLNLTAASGMQVLLQNRMEEMMKSIEKLEAKIAPPAEEEAAADALALDARAGGEQPGGETAAQEPATAAANPAEDLGAPPAAPVRPRRKKAAMPLEQAAPADPEGEAPPPAARKRAPRKQQTADSE